MTDLEVSIIVPSYDSKNLVDRCLRSILRTNYQSFELIFVDDGSTDGSLEYVKEKFGYDERLKIVRNTKKLGPSATRNVGIKVARGKYLAFLETDMEVNPNWLDEALRVLESDPSIGAIQCKVLDITQKNRIQQVGIYIIPHTGWVISRGFGAKDKGQYDDSRETSMGAVGSIVKREVIDKVSGFDEMLVHNIDDIDLGWRVWLAGYRVVTAPEAVVYHWTAKPSEVREKSTSKLLSEFHFNKVPRMLLKNYEFRNVVRYLPQAIVIYLIRSLINLAKSDPMSFIVFLKASIWNLKVMRSTLKERYRIQRSRKVSDEHLLQRIMIHGSFLEIYKTYLLPLLVKARTFHRV